MFASSFSSILFTILKIICWAIDRLTQLFEIFCGLTKVSYKGVSGQIEFDEIGDAKRDAAYIKTANTESGEWEFVTVQGVG